MVSNTGKFSIIAYITSTTYFVKLIICTLTLLTHSTPLTAGRVDPLPLPPQCATPPCYEPSPSNHHHGLYVVDPAPRHLSIASWVCRLVFSPRGDLSLPSWEWRPLLAAPHSLPISAYSILLCRLSTAHPAAPLWGSALSFKFQP